MLINLVMFEKEKDIIPHIYDIKEMLDALSLL